LKHVHIHILATALAICAGCAAPRTDRRDDLPPWEPAMPPAPEVTEIPPVGTDSSLEDLVQYALVRNPGLLAAFERWRAAAERVPQAEALPAPRLTLADYLAEVETRVGPMRARIGLAQPFPWFGKRGAAASAAEHLARAAGSEVDAQRLALVSRVRKAWYELGWLGQAIEITERHRELLLRWEDVARSQFESGRGSLADVIRAQVELGKLENRVQALRDLRRPTAARLNAALGREADAVLPTPPAGPSDVDELDGDALRVERINQLIRALPEPARHGLRPLRVIRTGLASEVPA